ncbi:MAG: PD-(D/E)XK nuclease family protein [Flavobacteriia bacterium]|nr:PD-(D/E)XK nuclease family protein [Flavobacteriia bacterium]
MNFIDQIATYIKENDFDLRNLTVVLPSERATKYLSQALFNTYGKPIFSPEIITIDRWVKKHSLPIIDKTRLLLYLFEMYLETEECKDATFEEFLTWGMIVLSDFDDIDRYMLDHEQVFKNLKAIKELESWQIDEENFSASQVKFMEFWDRLPKYYAELHKKLQNKNTITASLAYRKLAENTVVVLSGNEKQHFIFAGFNALSKSELSIIKNLLKLKKASFLVDADIFYYENKIHEAGAFIRKNMEFLEIGKPEIIGDNLWDKNLVMNVVECAQHTGQVKVAATELSKLSPAELDSTLVLLADETLISSMVKNIPISVGKANITLGLPLSQTPIKTWVELIFDIQENKSRFKSNAIYYKDLQRIINHVFTLGAINREEKRILVSLEQDTIRKNKVFQNCDKLDLGKNTYKIIQLITQDWKQDWKKAMEVIRSLNKILLELLPITNEFERNIIRVFDEALLEFEQILKEGIPKIALRSFKLLFFQHWGGKSIAYHGNPIQGLQVMGLLETRLLDFEHLIIVGLNEGKLPNTNVLNSVIPMDLRYGLGLPSLREKQGLFAHHFYRLLHKCKTFTATYTTAVEQISSNEASRYLLQLELELANYTKKVELKKHFYSVPFPELQVLPATIVAKQEEILIRLNTFFERSISASGLNKYITCPLDFYYRYIVEFGEEKAVEEDLESSTFGSLIHKTLELLFQPFAQRDTNGNPVSPAPKNLEIKDVEKMLTSYKGILYQEFSNYFNNDEQLFLKGKNLLSYEMAMQITENTLKAEKMFLEKQTEPVFIEQVEAEMTSSVEIELNGEKKTINFKGYIDRIDRIGSKYRVIDYKTGKVTKKDVEFKIIEAGLIPSFAACKHALQLALYSIFFKEKYKVIPDVAAIYSLVNLKDSFELKLEGKTNLEEFPEIFKELVELVISEIYNLELPFEHESTSKYCSFCN